MDIFLIYASTSGNVETVMEFVAELLKRHGYNPHLLRAEKTSLEIIQNNHHFILATSTWEHGLLNPFFAELFGEMQKADLHGKQAAFIGLGDKRYEPVLFCQGMERLREGWSKQGGAEIGEALKIEGEPYSQLEVVVSPWFQNIVHLLPHA